jgi:hypothetical protein
MGSGNTDSETGSRPFPDIDDPWKRVGELEAELAELRCLLEESRDREARLRSVLEERGVGVTRGGDPETELEILRLTQMLEERSSELQTIYRSKGWKLVQALRGLVGRRW